MKTDRLRHKLEIENPVAGNDLAGLDENDWEHFRTEYAAIQPVRGAEYRQADQMQATASHKITTRYFEGYSPRQRLVGSGRVFHPESVICLNEQGRFLEWMCSEVLGGSV